MNEQENEYCPDGKCDHDFESNDESAYCANGCGETYQNFIIKKLNKLIADKNKIMQEKDEQIAELKDEVDFKKRLIESQSHLILKIHKNELLQKEQIKKLKECVDFIIGIITSGHITRHDLFMIEQELLKHSKELEGEG